MLSRMMSGIWPRLRWIVEDANRHSIGIACVEHPVVLWLLQWLYRRLYTSTLASYNINVLSGVTRQPQDAAMISLVSEPVARPS